MKTHIRQALLLCTLAIAASHNAAAVEIGLAAATTSGFGLTDGTPLPTGNLVRFGVFKIGNYEIAANADNLAYLDSQFIELTHTFIGNNNPTGSAGGDSDPANAGLFTAGISGVNTTASGFNIEGMLLVYWVYNHANSQLATEHGIFSSTSWQIPSGNGSPEDMADLYTDISNLTVGNFGQTLAPTAQIIVGSFGPGINPQGYGINFNLHAVPEPRAAALLLCASALGAMLLRRRIAS